MCKAHTAMRIVVGDHCSWLPPDVDTRAWHCYVSGVSDAVKPQRAPDNGPH